MIRSRSKTTADLVLSFEEKLCEVIPLACRLPGDKRHAFLHGFLAGCGLVDWKIVRKSDIFFEIALLFYSGDEYVHRPVYLG